MFRHDGADMGDMVLELQYRQAPLPGKGVCQAAGKVVGMKIPHRKTRLNFKQREHVTQGFLEEREVFRMTDVADMLTGKRFPPAGETEGMLEFRSCGEDAVVVSAGRPVGQRQRLGTKPRARRTIRAGTGE